MNQQTIPAIVILISGSGSNLQAFIDAIHDGKLKAKIAAVISNKADAYGLVRAQNAGIPHYVIEHTQFDDRESFDKAVAEKIEQFHPQLVILAGFMRILTPAFVQTFAGRLLNIHPALLPKYKGLHTHRRALEAGDKWHGSSVHFVTEELDGGPVIAQARLAILPEHDEESLTRDVQKLEHKLYPLVAQWFVSKKLVFADGQLYLDGNKLAKPLLLEAHQLVDSTS